MTHTDLIARLRGADEYEPVGHDAWEAADALTAAQERIEALEDALKLIQDHRKKCHEYDLDTGNELRDFDEEDIKIMEYCARAALESTHNT